MVLKQPSRRPQERGFTLIEALLSLALVGVMMTGLLGLFSKSMSNNVEGQALGEVTRIARMRAEELMALPIDAEELTLPDGDLELVIEELFHPDDERWYTAAHYPAGPGPLYSRVTRVRQFNTQALALGDVVLEADERVPGGTASRFVHVKEIEIRVNTGQAETEILLGSRRKAVNLRFLKAI